MFFISWCYGLKFIPTILTVLTSFWAILTNHCHSLCEIRNCTCYLQHTPIIGDIGNESIGWADQNWTLNSARLLILLLVVTHFGKFILSTAQKLIEYISVNSILSHYCLFQLQFLLVSFIVAI